MLLIVIEYWEYDEDSLIDVCFGAVYKPWLGLRLQLQVLFNVVEMTPRKIYTAPKLITEPKVEPKPRFG